MSIVINLLFRDYSILVGDTRMMGHDENGNQVVAFEHFPKVFSVSKGLAYGYTGSVPFAAALSDYVCHLPPLERMYSDQLAYRILEKTQSLQSKVDGSIQVVVTGITGSYEMASFTISCPHGDYRLDKYVADSAIRTLNLCDTPFDEVLNRNLTEVLASNTPDKLAAARQCLVDHVAYVAERNQTVNNHAMVINISF